MKLPNRKILLGSALGLALAIFALDRLSGGGPRTADAAARTSSASQPLTGSEGDALPPQAQREAGPVAAQTADDIATLLRRIEAEHDPVSTLHLADLARDPFVATAALRATASGTAGATASPSKEAQPEKADVPFEKRHRLLGVVTGPVPLAVIDGEPYRLGDTIDGYRLIDIQREYAVLSRETTVLTLHIVREVPAPAR